MSFELDAPARLARTVENWDDWANGKLHVIVMGEDTPDISVDRFRNRAYSAAERRDRKAETKVASSKLLADDSDSAIAWTPEMKAQVQRLLDAGKTVILLVMTPAVSDSQ